MGRPKYYWNGIAKKMITMYPDLDKENSIQASMFKKAIEQALRETRELPNGDLRLRAIEEVYFKKTKTYNGVAFDIMYSPTTVQRWLNSFVNLVGKKAGY